MKGDTLRASEARYRYFLDQSLENLINALNERGCCIHEYPNVMAVKEQIEKLRYGECARCKETP